MVIFISIGFIKKGGRIPVLHEYPSTNTKMLVMTGTITMLVLGQASCMGPRKSHNGRVRVLFLGTPEENTAYQCMKYDPLIDPTPVTALDLFADIETITRSMRQYLPRNYEDLIEKYDVVSLQWATEDYVRHDFKKWLTDAVEKEGLGLFFAGISTSFTPWFSTTVADVLPVDHVEPFGFLKTLRPKILKPEQALMASVPWSSVGQYGMFPWTNTVKAKAGSETLANMESILSGEEYPFLVWWDVGEGRSFTMTTSYYGMGAEAWREFLKWEYHIDWQTNLHLFLANQPIPKNLQLLHKLREGFWEIRIQRNSIASVIEFSSRWGGNVNPVWKMLGKADDKLREAMTSYLEQDFDNALTLVDDIWTDLEETEEVAYSLKNQTLIWVYLTEWLALTGTAIITGAAVWGLMVKKRLYKEVETTMLAKPAS